LFEKMLFFSFYARNPMPSRLTFITISGKIILTMTLKEGTLWTRAVAAIYRAEVAMGSLSR